MTFQSVSVIKFIYLFQCNFLKQGRIGSFFRAAVPDDIDQGSPNPSLWGAPSATLSNSSCDIEKFFLNHSVVFGKCNLFSYYIYFHH